MGTFGVCSPLATLCAVGFVLPKKIIAPERVSLTRAMLLHANPRPLVFAPFAPPIS